MKLRSKIFASTIAGATLVMGVLGGSASASLTDTYYSRGNTSPWEQLCSTSGATPAYSRTPGQLACYVLTSAGGLDETWVERLSEVCERAYGGSVERTVVGNPPNDSLYCYLPPFGG